MVNDTDLMVFGVILSPTLILAFDLNPSPSEYAPASQFES